MNNKGGKKVATRASVDYYIQQAENAIHYAHDQLVEWKKQEHYNQTEYTEAQSQLEAAYNDLQDLMLSANAQQKERIYRIQLQIREAQNDLVLDEQDLIQ